MNPEQITNLTTIDNLTRRLFQHNNHVAILWGHIRPHVLLHNSGANSIKRSRHDAPMLTNDIISIANLNTQIISSKTSITICLRNKCDNFQILPRLKLTTPIHKINVYQAIRPTCPSYTARKSIQQQRKLPSTTLLERKLAQSTLVHYQHQAKKQQWPNTRSIDGDNRNNSIQRIITQLTQKLNKSSEPSLIGS
jgi:hypothetical protein